MSDPNKNNFASKWSKAILRHGFTAVPNLLLKCRKEIGLTSTECLVVIAIDSFRWDNDDPWPSLEALSRRCGFSPRTLSRTITSLEEKRAINRIKRFGTSNKYDLSPIIEWLEFFAERDTQGPFDRPIINDWADIIDVTPLSLKEDSTKNTQLKTPNKNIIVSGEIIQPDTRRGHVV